MSSNLKQAFICVAVLSLLTLVTGCSTVSQHTRAYLGSPHYAESNPAAIQILQEEPKQLKERLGEVVLTVDGNPKREKIEQKLREGSAKLGADAVFIVYDKVHVFPVLYYDWWWGPMSATESMGRMIVGVAVKFK